MICTNWKRISPQWIQKREKVLLDHGIGLGDTLSKAERQGSLDKDIVSKILIDKKGIIRNHPEVVFLPNGKKAYKWFLVRPGNEFKDKLLDPVPSSSGSNTHLTLDEKIEVWKSRIKAVLL